MEIIDILHRRFIFASCAVQIFFWFFYLIFSLSVQSSRNKLKRKRNQQRQTKNIIKYWMKNVKWKRNMNQINERKSHRVHKMRDARFHMNRAHNATFFFFFCFMFIGFASLCLRLSVLFLSISSLVCFATRFVFCLLFSVLVCALCTIAVSRSIRYSSEFRVPRGNHFSHAIIFYFYYFHNW